MPTDIYLNNSGLILLHPYLPMLFERLDYLDETKNWLPEKAECAVLLLQKMVQPQGEIQEIDLPLNKLLCGLPLTEPASTDFSPTDQELEMCNSLLTAIMQQWQPMQNSSIEAFREAWLQRFGKLAEQEEKWELVVEKKAYDVLLSSLPFSISLIKNRWMKKSIVVNWAS